MAFSQFQYAVASGTTNQRTKIETNEDWVIDNDVKAIRLKESMGDAARTLEVQINNPDGLNKDRYKAFQRVRLTDRRSHVVLFLGRVDVITPDHRKQHITLLCRDYMSELVEGNVVAPLLTGNRRSDIVKRIIAGHDGRTWKSSDGVFQATDRSSAFDSQERAMHQQHESDKNVNPWTHVDDSPDSEVITKNYGSGGNSGYKSFHEAIEGLSTEDMWQDQQVLLYTHPSLPIASGNSEYLKRLTPAAGGGLLPGDGEAGWIHGTAEMASGAGKIPKPQNAVSAGTGTTGMVLYVGSSRQFHGIDFTLQPQTGGYQGLDVEYYNGSSWSNVLNVTDGTDALEKNGKMTWRSAGSTHSAWKPKANLTGVEAEDNWSGFFVTNNNDNGVSRYKNSYSQSNTLTWDGTDYDKVGANYIDGGAKTSDGWTASDQADDYGGNKMVTGLGDPPLTNLFWIRIKVTKTASSGESSTNPGSIYSLRILPTAVGTTTTSTDPDDYLAPEAKYDFRMQDPFFFDSVAYSQQASNWSDHTVAATTKYSSDNFNFLSGSTGKFYVGADRPFGGIEFQLSTNGAGYSAGSFQYKYWDGNSWQAVIDDNSYAYDKDGSVRFNSGSSTSISINTGWRRRSLQGDGIADDVTSAATPIVSLYWMQIDYSGTSSTTAVVKLMRSINVAAFAYFERGTEPWNYNVQGTRDGGGPTTRLRDAEDGLGDDGGYFSTVSRGHRVFNVSNTSAAHNTSPPRSTTVAYGTDIFSNYLDLDAGIFPTSHNTAKYNLENTKEYGNKAYSSFGDSLHNANWHGERNNWHGLTLEWRGSEKDWQLPIYRYEIGDAPVDLMTRITVYGKEPSSGTAINKKREAEYGIKKHKTLYDRTLISNQECKTKAEAILRTYEPQSTTTVRRGVIEVYNYPTYKFNPTTRNVTIGGENKNIPRAVRAGDMVNVTIKDGSLNLVNEKFLVWAIDYNDTNSLAKMTVSQDLIPSFGNVPTAYKRAVEAERLAMDASQQNATPSSTSAKDIVLSANETKADTRARIHVEDSYISENYEQDGYLQTESMVGRTTINFQKYNVSHDPYAMPSEVGDYGTSSYESSNLGNDNFDNAFSIHPNQGGALTFAGTSNDFYGTSDAGSSGNVLFDASASFEWSYIGLPILKGTAEYYITEVLGEHRLLTSGTPNWGTGNSYTIKFESEIASNTAGFYYNTTDHTFKAKVEAAAPYATNTSGADLDGTGNKQLAYEPQWHHVPVGEWGSVTTNSIGIATILLDNTYAAKPVVLLTVDTSASTGGEQSTIFQKRWAEVEKMTDASNNVSNSAITKVQIKVYEARLNLTSGGASDNLQLTSSGSLYTSDNSSTNVNTADAAGACRVMYFVMPPPRNSQNS